MPELLTLLTRVAAVVLLNALVTFRNWWPTPAVWWNGDPSLELAVLLLALALAVGAGRIEPQSKRVLRWLSGIWIVLAIGRYVDVTAPALWGRELNFFWDLRFLPDVAAMIVGASRQAVLIGVLATVAALVVFGALFISIRWSFRQVLATVGEPRGRVALAAVGGVLVALFIVQLTGAFGRDLYGEEWRLFPKPVTQVYARQARLVLQAVTETKALPPSPDLDANLAGVRDADVFLFFIESYGAVTFDQPDFNRRLTAPRSMLEAAVRETGREAVSAYVESPTFGGSSWFAHISFLSGLRVADPDANALLMTEQRQTVVTTFARRGYRTVAMMPGLWYPWPEGGFYGFQEIYDGWRMNYRGPTFGWWDMPDQFVLARLEEQETTKPDRPPLFVFYPTVSTHAPFGPRAPYQPDWPRMLTTTPFEQADLDRAYTEEPDWMNLAPDYTAAVAYTYETFAGYVRQRAGRDYVMILIGDHQPPAIVSGERVPWDVPVHVITNRRSVLDALAARGFVSGLTPKRPRLGDMHQLVPVMMEAFSTAN